MVTRSHSNSLCPRWRMDGTIPWPTPKPTTSLTVSSFPLESSLVFVPKELSSYTEASKQLQWHFAMTTEIDALLLNKTWDLYHLPPPIIYSVPSGS